MLGWALNLGFAGGSLWNQQTAVTTAWTPQTAASSYWIEQGYKNLVLSSEDFSDDSFSLVEVSLLTGQSDPEGGSTATKIIESAAANKFHAITSTYTGLASNVRHYISIFAKASERSGISLICRTKAGAFPGVTFDCSAGTVLGGFSSPQVEDYGVIDYGGFYRLYVGFNIEDGATTPQFYPQLYNGASQYTGDGSSGLIIWGMQLNEGATLQPYSKTTGSANTLTTWTEQ